MTTLHLVRGEAVPVAVGAGDVVVRLEPERIVLVTPAREQVIDSERLVELVFAAARVITW